MGAGGTGRFSFVRVSLCRRPDAVYSWTDDNLIPLDQVMAVLMLGLTPVGCTAQGQGPAPRAIFVMVIGRFRGGRGTE